MVYESGPWKEDLKRRRQLLLQYNTKEHFKKDEDKAYIVIEKAIFYSAFIIRKLLDCNGKMSDEADQYAIKVTEWKPTRKITVMHRWPKEGEFDWEEGKTKNVLGNKVCNWLIHSFVFFTEVNEDGTIESFFVSSDYDKNKVAYQVEITEWEKYMKFIETDWVVSLHSHYDEKIQDYVFTKKERG